MTLKYYIILQLSIKHDERLLPLFPELFNSFGLLLLFDFVAFSFRFYVDLDPKVKVRPIRIYGFQQPLESAGNRVVWFSVLPRYGGTADLYGQRNKVINAGIC